MRMPPLVPLCLLIPTLASACLDAGRGAVSGVSPDSSAQTDAGVEPSADATDPPGADLNPTPDVDDPREPPPPPPPHETACTSVAQSFGTEYEPRAIAAGLAGDVLVAGIHDRPGAPNDAWFAILAEDGSVVLSQALGGAGPDAFDAVALADGGYYRGGAWHEDQREAFLQALDPDGGVRWTWQEDETSDVSHIVAHPGGGVLAAGDVMEPGVRDSWVRRFDAQGKVLWAARIDVGYKDETGALLALGDGGALLYTRVTEKDNTFRHLLTRLDGDGQELWRRPIHDKETKQIFDVALVQGDTPSTAWVAADLTQGFSVRRTELQLVGLTPDTLEDLRVDDVEFLIYAGRDDQGGIVMLHGWRDIRVSHLDPTTGEVSAQADVDNTNWRFIPHDLRAATRLDSDVFAYVAIGWPDRWADGTEYGGFWRVSPFDDCHDPNPPCLGADTCETEALCQQSICDAHVAGCTLIAERSGVDCGEGLVCDEGSCSKCKVDCEIGAYSCMGPHSVFMCQALDNGCPVEGGFSCVDGTTCDYDAGPCEPGEQLF